MSNYYKTRCTDNIVTAQETQKKKSLVSFFSQQFFSLLFSVPALFSLLMQYLNSIFHLIQITALIWRNIESIQSWLELQKQWYYMWLWTSCVFFFSFFFLHFLLLLHPISPHSAWRPRLSVIKSARRYFIWQIVVVQMIFLIVETLVPSLLCVHLSNICSRKCHITFTCS